MTTVFFRLPGLIDQRRFQKRVVVGISRSMLKTRTTRNGSPSGGHSLSLLSSSTSNGGASEAFAVPSITLQSLSLAVQKTPNNSSFVHSDASCSHGCRGFSRCSAAINMTSHGESVDVGDAFGLLSRAGAIDHAWAHGGRSGSSSRNRASWASMYSPA